MDKRKNSSLLLVAAGLLACLVMFALIFLIILRAELNQDEGWYLYGAGLIHDGLTPYIDFATTQGPVMQYVYSFFWAVLAKWGVMGGRIITAVFGLGAVGLAVAAAWRVMEKGRRGPGALAVLCLAGLNTYQLFFFSTVKTYALAGFWIGLSFFLLTFAGRGKHLCAFLAGVFMMLAAATRMSAGAMLPAVAVCLLLEARSDGNLKSDFRWLLYVAGSLLCMAAVFGPFVLKAPESVKFAMFDYHAGRQAGSAAALVYKGGFIARAVRAYYPALLAMLGVAVYGMFLRRKGAPGACSIIEKRFSSMLLVSVLLVSLLHFAAPFPYDDYQAMIFPLFCAGVVIAGARLIPEEHLGRTAFLFLFGALLFAGASPLNERMFIGKRDRIWWPIRKETSLQKLGRAADFVSRHAGDSKELLTQDLYIALEAGMKVPRGLELGPFSFFPELTREQAEKLHVVNCEILRELIASSPAKVCALSGYSFAIKAPEISPYDQRAEMIDLIEERFEPVEKIDDFGQAETELTVYVRRAQ